MIRVALRAGLLEVKFHGDPIVCAGVSALTITCVNFIKGKLQPNAQLDFDDEGGFIHLSYDDSCRDVGLVIALLHDGLEQIKEIHPNEIMIKKGD